MSKQIPIQVQQMIDAVNDKANPKFVRQNYATSLENIKERIDATLSSYYRRGK
jgi:hypothetical protein